MFCMERAAKICIVVLRGNKNTELTSYIIAN